MSVLLLTACGYEMQPWKNKVMANREMYARRYGYSVSVVDVFHDRRLPLSWSRLYEVQAAMESYEYVFWLDADAVIVNMLKPLDELLKLKQELIVDQRADESIDLSAALWRTSWRAKSAIDRALAAADKCRTTLYGEQQALADDIEREPHFECMSPAKTVFGRFVTWPVFDSSKAFIAHRSGGGRFVKEARLERLWRPDSWITNKHDTAVRFVPRIEELGSWFVSMGLDSRGVMVSSRNFELVGQLRKTWPGDLHVVSLFERERLEAVRDHNRPLATTIHSVNSLAGSLIFGRQLPNSGLVDWVYLAGDMRYAAALAGIDAWWPNVRSGGVLCGDMYLDGIFTVDGSVAEAGVKSAVDQFAAEHGLRVLTTTGYGWPAWAILKPNEEQHERKTES